MQILDVNRGQKYGVDSWREGFEQGFRGGRKQAEGGNDAGDMEVLVEQTESLGKLDDGDLVAKDRGCNYGYMSFGVHGDVNEVLRNECVGVLCK